LSWREPVRVLPMRCRWLEGYLTPTWENNILHI
jgi:hypothetical protein